MPRPGEVFLYPVELERVKRNAWHDGFRFGVLCAFVVALAAALLARGTP